MKKMIRCANCGTKLKETDISCPICHMKPERTEEEEKKVEEKIIHNDNKNIIWKFIILFLFILGIVLTVIGFIHMKDLSYCSSEECTTNNLFVLLIGSTLTVSSFITLIRSLKK